VDARYYVDLGRSAILQILDQEHAAPWLEIEARAADRRLASFETIVDPHALTLARGELRDESVIVETLSETRGGRSISVLHLADTRGRADAILRAAARKRLLQSRYLNWAVGTPTQAAVIGPGGERVVHESLKVAAVSGYRLLNPDGGHVSDLLGHPVPIGPLDGAAFLQVVDDQERPAGSVAVLIEVKNVRGWIYPETADLFQLLDKAAQLQVANPDVAFMPLLVCRRAHKTTYNAARDLGFFVIELWTQYMLPSARIRSDHLEEVRAELGYLDLVPSSAPDPKLVKRLQVTVPARAALSAERWVRTASSPAGSLFSLLRNDGLYGAERTTVMNELRNVARGLPGTKSGW
jgi:hypothetical protein